MKTSQCVNFLWKQSPRTHTKCSSHTCAAHGRGAGAPAEGRRAPRAHAGNACVTREAAFCSFLQVIPLPAPKYWPPVCSLCPRPCPFWGFMYPGHTSLVICFYSKRVTCKVANTPLTIAPAAFHELQFKVLYSPYDYFSSVMGYSRA